jgi:hypothetical protein
MNGESRYHHLQQLLLPKATMDASNTPGTRRTEDIALDLLKFVAAHANLGAKSASSTPGFAPSSSSKGEDQLDSLFSLYARCREAVETPVKK